MLPVDVLVVKWQWETSFAEIETVAWCESHSAVLTGQLQAVGAVMPSHNAVRLAGMEGWRDGGMDGWMEGGREAVPRRQGGRAGASGSPFERGSLPRTVQGWKD